MKASILDLRYKTKEVLRALDRGESVSVTHRGKERARLVPIARSKAAAKTLQVPDAIGMWKDRADLLDVSAHVRTLRAGRFPKVRPDAD